MHETSVTADIVDAVIAELQNYNIKKVNNVTIVIGDFTQLGEEQISFAWDVLTKNTILDGAELVIKKEEIILQCEKCRYKGPAEKVDFGYNESHYIPLLLCPKCGGKPEIIQGKACRIESFDIDEA